MHEYGAMKILKLQNMCSLHGVKAEAWFSVVRGESLAWHVFSTQWTRIDIWAIYCTPSSTKDSWKTTVRREDRVITKGLWSPRSRRGTSECVWFNDAINSDER
jgi:hypothetical protein